MKYSKSSVQFRSRGFREVRNKKTLFVVGVKIVGGIETRKAIL
jgi:hypothetical protein